MLGERQEHFIERVKVALRDRGEPVALPDDLEIARVIGDELDRVQIFAERVEQAKMHAYRVADNAAMIEQVLSIVASVGAKSAIVPEEAIPAREQLIARLRAAGITLFDANDRDAAFTADVGITAVTTAIAETGSMCLTSGGARRRLASLAVPYHIGIVRTEQIVADLLDWAYQLPAALTANEVLVSGPSKTADIELILVTGVHGPKAEHVVIVG
jgi:L-lactate dehydrogenase complex protein LldG